MTEREIEVQDVPHPQKPPMGLKHLAGLELDGCNVLVITMRLNEFELKQNGLGHRFETWPEAVRQRMEREIADFSARNRGGAIRAVTTGLNDGLAVLALHWRQG